MLPTLLRTYQTVPLVDSWKLYNGTRTRSTVHLCRLDGWLHYSRLQNKELAKNVVSSFYDDTARTRSLRILEHEQRVCCMACSHSHHTHTLTVQSFPLYQQHGDLLFTTVCAILYVVATIVVRSLLICRERCFVLRIVYCAVLLHLLCSLLFMAQVRSA